MKVYSLFAEHRVSRAASMYVLYFFKKEDVSDADLQGIAVADINTTFDVLYDEMEIFDVESFAQAKECYLYSKESMQNFYNY